MTKIFRSNTVNCSFDVNYDHSQEKPKISTDINTPNIRGVDKSKESAKRIYILKQSKITQNILRRRHYTKRRQIFQVKN